MPIDHFYDDAFLSAIYDAWHPRHVRDDFDFYLPLILGSKAVLDVGCGTGTLLNEARNAGHQGRLCGIDPAPGVLSHARQYPEIDWVLGELPQQNWQNRFDLVVMTGHAFQTIVADLDITTFLAAVRNCLVPSGVFAFESRNPSVRAWERWTPENPSTVQMQDGTVVEITTELTSGFDGQTVSFSHAFRGVHPNLPMQSQSTLRFHDVGMLAKLLEGAGFVVDRQYGDFDLSHLTSRSPEIITLARRL